MVEARSVNATYTSFGSLLEDLSGLFPSSLIDGPGWEKLQALAHRLPVCVADSRFGFEFRLCDPSPAADLCVIAAPETRLAKFYRSQTRESAEGLTGIAFRDWIGQQARNPDSFLARTGRGIILEYDLAESPAGRHGIPGVFIVTRGNQGPPLVDLREDPAGLVAALSLAAGWAPDPEELRQVEQACKALAGSGIGISHAGALPGRAERAIRLVAMNAAGGLVGEALERLQWPGDQAAAAAVLAHMEGLTSSGVGLDIDISREGLSPRLGLEFSRLVGHPSPAEQFRLDRPGWKPIIDRLEEKGWCLPVKAGGLRDWPRLDFCFGKDGVYQVRQVLSHFKVVIAPGGTYAKAYAGMDLRRTAAKRHATSSFTPGDFDEPSAQDSPLSVASFLPYGNNLPQRPDDHFAFHSGEVRGNQICEELPRRTRHPVNPAGIVKLPAHADAGLQHDPGSCLFRKFTVVEVFQALRHGRFQVERASRSGPADQFFHQCPYLPLIVQV